MRVCFRELDVLKSRQTLIVFIYLEKLIKKRKHDTKIGEKNLEKEYTGPCYGEQVETVCCSSSTVQRTCRILCTVRQKRQTLGRQVAYKGL